MVDLILQLILFASFAVIVYLMAIAVPRVKDDELTAASGKTSSILPLERMDAFLNSFKEKSLRRLRIYLLKAESSVAGQLQKSRKLGPIKGFKRAKTPEKPPEVKDSEQS